jgi:hypothetical protein
MKSLRHVFFTWLLSHLFHPFVFAFYLIIQGEANAEEIIPVLFLVGPLLALPSLFFGWAFLQYLYVNTAKTSFSLFIWMLMVPISISLNFLMVVLLTGEPSSVTKEANLLLPAIVSSCLAVLFRVQQFHQLFDSKSTDHENNLV